MLESASRTALVHSIDQAAGVARARDASPAAIAAADLSFARAMLREGAAAIDCLADGIDESFARATSLILAAQGRLIVGGLGKSGHVGRKLAATFSSTGTPALFLHLAE